MDINQLLVTLIIIFLPGIIASVVCDKIAIHSKWTSFKFSLYAFVLGIFSYIVLQLLYYVADIIRLGSLINVKWTHLGIWNSFVAGASIPPLEIIFATILSIPVSFWAAYIINRKILNWFARMLRVSTKYGDENLFSYYLSSPDVDWVYIRDLENNLTYQGRIASYSETDQMQEIVMYEVTVFRYNDSAELYSVPKIYLTREIGKFVIEEAKANQ